MFIEAHWVAVKISTILVAVVACCSAYGQSVTAVTLTSSAVRGGTSSNGIVTLDAAAPSGGAVVSLSSHLPNLVGVPATVTVSEGRTAATFPIATTEHPDTYIDRITATLGSSSQYATLTIYDDSLKSLTAPTGLVGGQAAHGTVTLLAAAPPGGWTVNLTSLDPNQIAVSSSVIVPAGQTSTIFDVRAQKATASYKGTITATDATSSISIPVSVTDDSIEALAVAPSTVEATHPCTGTIQLQSVAPAGGWTVTLRSQYPSYVTVPSTVTIPAGASIASFPIATTSLSHPFSDIITASDATSSISKTLTVNVGPHSIQVLTGVFLGAESLAYDPVHDLLIVVPGSQNGTLLFYNPSTGILVKTVTLTSAPTQVVMSGDNTNLIVACSDGTVRILDTATWTVEVTVNLPGGSGAQMLLSIAKTSASFVVQNGGATYIFDGSIQRPNTASFGPIAAISADGTHFVGCDWPNGPYKVAEINADGFAHVASGYGQTSPDLTDQSGYPVDGTGSVLNPNTGQLLYTLPLTPSPNRRVSPVPGTNVLIAQSWPPDTLQILDVVTRQSLSIFQLINTDGGMGPGIWCGHHRFVYYNFGEINDPQFVILTAPEIP